MQAKVQSYALTALKKGAFRSSLSGAHFEIGVINKLNIRWCKERERV